MLLGRVLKRCFATNVPLVELDFYQTPPTSSGVGQVNAEGTTGLSLDPPVSTTA